MTKVFTVNKDGKIELTKDELQKLLDDSYWEGYRANNTYVYTSPSWKPWTVTYCSTADATIDASNIMQDSVTISLNDISAAINSGDVKVEV